MPALALLLASMSPACATRVPASWPSGRSLVWNLAPPDQGFYSRATSWGGIAVLAHASVDPAALLAVRDRLERMLSHAPSIVANLDQRHAGVRVAGRHQLVSGLPEFVSLRGTRTNAGDDFDEHTRGGGHQFDRWTACAESNLLADAGARFSGHDICVHELAHLVMWLGLAPAIRSRVLNRMVEALVEGRWRDTYAATNHAEFFAELSM